MSAAPATVPAVEHEPSRLQVAAVAALAALAVGLLAWPSAHVNESAVRGLAGALGWWTVLPFALLLLVIAIAPLVAERAWERNRVKAAVALALGVPVAILLASQGAAGAFQLLEKAREYVSFICLLGALFVISGGIHLRGSLSGTPLMNAAFLALGAVLANLVGTTGASMLLVRPLLRANKARQAKAHVVVFFIFVVSNCGGLLTPLGDPPLFLGFLKGVPFDWTLRQLWGPWLAVNAALIVVFHIVDELVFNREERSRPGSQLEEVQQHQPLRIDGAGNFALLAGVLAVIYAAGQGLGRGGASWPFGLQEGAMLGLGLASYLLTPARVHHENHFNFGPIVEVAVLFAGIFVTMAPALLLLNAHGPSLGLTRPWHFFWATGALSSFLDNAPTYLTFAATASGLEGITVEGRYLAELLRSDIGAQLLRAISAGAVLMGANTYIGNGPNFMVKAVAERAGVKMPSFFGYMAWSGAVLIPIFLAVTLVFFRT